jgi:hypothetical protein
MKSFFQISFLREIQAGLAILILLLATHSAMGAATGVTSITFGSSDEHFMPSGTRTITFSVNIQCSASVPQLGLRVTSPLSGTEWTYVNCTGTNVPTALPQAGDLGPWTFGFLTTPGSSVKFDVTLRYTGPLALSSYSFVATPLVGTQDAVTTTGVVISATSTVRQAVFHSADTNQDLKLSLSEILKVIQIYNTRKSDVRTGAYVYSGTSFEPDPSVVAPVAPILTSSTHSADVSSPTSSTTSNGAIEAAEVTKLIALAGFTVDGVRTGQYHANPAATGFDKFVFGRK